MATVLLIEPFGIEMMMLERVPLPSALLIEPFGIEIAQGEAHRGQRDGF